MWAWPIGTWSSSCTRGCRWASAPFWPWLRPAVCPVRRPGGLRLGSPHPGGPVCAGADYAFSNLDHFETSSLVTRMTTDVTVIQNAVNGGLRPLARAPVLAVMGVGLSVWMNARLALVFLVCTPILAVILFCIVRKVGPMYAPLQKAVDRLNNVVQEGLTAIRAVKAFVRGESENEKFAAVNEELAAASQKTFHYAVLNLPAFQLVMYTSTVLFMWFGGNMILGGSSGGGSHRRAQLRAPGDELPDDALQSVPAAHPLPGQRPAHCGGCWTRRSCSPPGKRRGGGCPTAASTLKTSPSNTTPGRRSTPSPASPSTFRRGRRWAYWEAPARPRPPWCSSFPACTTPLRGPSRWPAGMCVSTSSTPCGTRWALCSRKTCSSPAPCGRI